MRRPKAALPKERPIGAGPLHTQPLTSAAGAVSRPSADQTPPVRRVSQFIQPLGSHLGNGLCPLDGLSHLDRDGGALNHLSRRLRNLLHVLSPPPIMWGSTGEGTRTPKPSRLSTTSRREDGVLGQPLSRAPHTAENGAHCPAGCSLRHARARDQDGNDAGRYTL